MSEKTIGHLLAAADILEADGWAQWGWGSDPAPVNAGEGPLCRCAWQALLAASGYDDLQASLALVRHLGMDDRKVGDGETHVSLIAEWNDGAGRTKDEVLNALRATASEVYEREAVS